MSQKLTSMRQEVCAEPITTVFVVNPGIDPETDKSGVGSVDYSPESSPECLIEKREISERPRYSQYGVILALVGSLSYSLTITLLNYLPQYDFYVSGIYRALFFTPPAIICVIWNKISLFPKDKVLLLILRGLGGIFSSYFSLYCIQYLPVSESATLLQMTPVFVTIIGAMCLKQKCSVFIVAIVTFILFGVFLVANPVELINDLHSTTVSNQVIGICFALLSDLMFAGVIISLEKLKFVHPSIIIVYYGSLTGLISVIGLWVKDKWRLPEDNTDLLLLCFMGVSYGIGQVAVVYAIKYEPATVVSMLLVSEVFFCSLLQLYLLSQPINAIEGVGVAIVAINIILLGFQRYISSLPSSSSLRQRFKLLLR